METQPHKYMTVAYELYSDNAEGIHELVEKAPAEHPFQFISGMGMVLDAFEEKLLPLASGGEFDFTLSVDDAYGPYLEEHVLDLDKQMFCVNGRFDKSNIYPGSVIPLVNEDGNHFQGIVVDVKDDKVVVDLNHPLAGKELHFKGSVVISRDATEDEIQGTLNRMSGGGCCGCGHEGHDCGHEGHGCGEKHEGCGCHGCH